MTFYGKIRPHRHLIQLPSWKGGLFILDIDTPLNSLKMKSIQRLLHPINALWKDPSIGSHAVSIELKFELQPWLSPFQTKSNSPTHCK